MAEPLTKQLKQALVERYDDFAARVCENYQASADKSEEGLNAALESVQQQMSGIGALSPEQAQSFASYVKRDLVRIAVELRRTDGKGDAGTGARGSLIRLLQLAGDALGALTDQADSGEAYRRGEITAAGRLICLKCGYEQDFAETTYIGACPVCDGTTFRKAL